MINFTYRPDVDGLRAVAVVLVLLFHAEIGFPGGFVGVDVFFVISGFLITGIILRQLENDEFSLARFWQRRIRRILPAAMTMAIVVVSLGYLLLLPDDYAELGRSAVAQQLMLSNVFFWQETGYFAGPAEIKPLLHTWSLAVEEQFYLGYPFLLVALHRFGRRVTLVALASVAGISLIASIFGVARHPAACFFLLPTRAWELLIGGLIWFVPSPRGLPRFVRTTGSWIALLTILAVSLLYTASTPFPGLAAVPPCLATAVIIYTNSIERSSISRLLSLRPIVFVGLISYSLYLWHWPLMAFWRYWFFHIDPTSSVLLLGSSFLLGYLSWQHVEQRFRHKGFDSSRPSATIATALASSAILVFVGIMIVRSDGLPQRFDERVTLLASSDIAVPSGYSIDINGIDSGNVPPLGSSSQNVNNVEFALWGDSHALAVCALFDEMAEAENISGIAIARSSHAPILGVYKTNTGPEMREWNQSAIELIERRSIRDVFLVARWTTLIEGRVDGRTDTCLLDGADEVPTRERAQVAFRQGLRMTLKKLHSMNTRVWILLQVPLQNQDPRKQMIRSKYWTDEIPSGVSKSAHQDRQSRVNDVIRACAKEFPNTNVISPYGECFDENDLSRLGDEQGCFYADNDHLSPYGASKLLTPIFDPVFAGMKASDTRPGPLSE